MKGLIERAEVVGKITSADMQMAYRQMTGTEVYQEILGILNEAQDADVAPVVHGAWIDFYGDHKTAECSECQQLFEVTFDGPSKPEFFAAFQDFYRYCPNCGARMDGDSDAAD